MAYIYISQQTYSRRCIIWQVHHGRYITAGMLQKRILWQMYYGRYSRADTLRQKCPGRCLHCTNQFQGLFCCTARHCMWQAKNPRCMEWHGPAGRATMHGFAQKTCNWIPIFTDLHGTAWKVPVHMDPNLALLLELTSYESQSVTAYGATLRPCQSPGHGFHGKTLPMANIEPIAKMCMDPPHARICTRMLKFDDAPSCTENVQQGP